MLIRPEAPEDVDTIHNVVCLAFNRKDEAQLVDTLRTDHAFRHGMSLVALENNTIIGHALFSHLHTTSEKDEVRATALGPVAVTPAWQNKGIGARLIREGITRVAELGYQLVVVLGHTGYYTRFGFDVNLARSIDCVYSGDHFMALELEKDIMRKTGKIKATYASAFTALK